MTSKYYLYFFIQVNFISKTISNIVYFQIMYVFAYRCALYFFFKANFFQISIDKGRISPEMFEFLIKVVKLF